MMKELVAQRQREAEVRYLEWEINRWLNEGGEIDGPEYNGLIESLRELYRRAAGLPDKVEI